jgi:hypothetical protein
MLEDGECFEEGTKQGSLTSLFHTWDLNTNHLISPLEFHLSTNLDSNNLTTPLELSTYLSANRYLLCRPYRE